MIKRTLFLMMLGLSVITSSCVKKGCTDPQAINYSPQAKKDDGSCIIKEDTTDNIIKSGHITSDETWTSDNVYQLEGKVVVDNGVTLTIEPGTTIKGGQGTGTLASVLIISVGAQINAVGTPTNPIIFTSVLDNGNNLDENDNGMWGGVIILGDAPISAADGDDITQIEGIPATSTYGAFGGNDIHDDSGIFSYVSIRHAGALIGAGNEINGLTLGGVGDATVISNIEIVGNLDDGVEFFGGTVNVENIIVGFQGDDGIDIDMNYAGTVNNFVVINGISSDESLEIDGPEGMTHTNGLFTLTNGTMNGNIDLKSKAQGNVDSVKIQTIKIRSSYQNNCSDPKSDSFLNLFNGDLNFNNCQFTSIDVYTNSQDDGFNYCTVPSVDQIFAESVITNTPNNGADESVFSWTWLSQNGHL